MEGTPYWRESTPVVLSSVMKPIFVRQVSRLPPFARWNSNAFLGWSCLIKPSFIRLPAQHAMRHLDNRRRWELIVGGILLTLLLAAVLPFGSLVAPFEPKNWRAVLVLYAVSSFITAAFLVFGLILARTVLRLWVERSRDQLGARFKTKMVVGAMAISLLPIIFMFIVSYSLIKRSLLLWFPRPLEIASHETQKIKEDLGPAPFPPPSRQGF